MHEVTELLLQWKNGDPAALNRLLPLVYDELRRLARSELRPRQAHETMQPTALVNEVFVRLLGAEHSKINDTSHLFSTAARVMRQILVDQARARMRDKRGGGELRKVDLIEAAGLPIPDDTDLVELNDALVHLATEHPRIAEVVELRYFVGLEVKEVAEVLRLEERTVYRDWAFARAWLRTRLDG